MDCETGDLNGALAASASRKRTEKFMMPDSLGPVCRHRVEHGMFVRDRDVSDRRGTVLYIHGLGESGLCFEHLLDHPGLRGWRQLIPDLPGYGRSPWPAEPLGLADQADHLAGWLRSCASVGGAAPAAIIGHSMGGVTGLLFCERHPDLVSAFINIDGNLSPPDCVFSGRASRHSLDDFAGGGFEQLRRAVHRIGRDDRAHRGYYVSMRLADPRAYYRNSRELVDLSAPENLARRMAALTVPTRYIAGVPNGVSRRSRELLDQAGVAWTGIEPSGHWPFIDQPDSTVRAIVAALAGRTGKDPGPAAQ